MASRNLIYLVSVFIFLGCGGGSSKTTTVGDALLANNAVNSAPWAQETLSIPSDEKKIEIGETLNIIIQETILYYSTHFKHAKTTSNINTTLTGATGGTVKMVGTIEDGIESDPRPIDATSEIKFTFDGLKTNTCFLHGVLFYKAVFSYNSYDNFEGNITMHGGCSYKDADGVYSIKCQLEMNVTRINGATTVDYVYTINGDTFTGTK